MSVKQFSSAETKCAVQKEFGDEKIPVSRSDFSNHAREVLDLSFKGKYWTNLKQWGKTEGERGSASITTRYVSEARRGDKNRKSRELSREFDGLLLKRTER